MRYFHFADDTHLLHFALCLKINADLRILTSWLNVNKILSLNLSKTEYSIQNQKLWTPSFPSNKFSQVSNILVFISQNHYKTIASEHLNCKLHTFKTPNKHQKACGALSSFWHYIRLKSLLNIHHAIFLTCTMRVRCQVWGLHENTTCHRISTEFALRLITFNSPCQISF